MKKNSFFKHVSQTLFFLLHLFLTKREGAACTRRMSGVYIMQTTMMGGVGCWGKKEKG